MRHAGNRRYRSQFDLKARDWTSIKAYRAGPWSSLNSRAQER